MANIFRSLDSEDSVFRDESVLMPDYLPDELSHREKEIKEIAFSLRNVSKGKRCENLVLVGPSGTGKTSSAKYVLRHLTEYTTRAIPVYINCWEVSTRFGILNAICSKLGEFLPRRGIATDEITQRMVSAIKREKKVPIVVLDEIDRLFATQHNEEKVLYDLVRANENYSIDIGIIGITNSESFLSKVDRRVRSSLAQKSVHYSKYTPGELKDILNERAKLSFLPGKLEDEVIPLCAAIGAKNGGDARLSINVLWQAGKQAERGSGKKVTVDHVKKVKESAIKDRSMDFTRFSDIEKKIISVINEQGQIDSGELYEKLDGNERTIRNYVKKLEKLGIIDSVNVTKGQGKTRVFKIRKPL